MVGNDDALGTVVDRSPGVVGMEDPLHEERQPALCFRRARSSQVRDGPEKTSPKYLRARTVWSLGRPPIASRKTGSPR